MMLSCKVSLAMHIDAFPYDSDWGKKLRLSEDSPLVWHGIRWKGEAKTRGASAQKASEKRSFPLLSRKSYLVGLLLYAETKRVKTVTLKECFVSHGQTL